MKVTLIHTGLPDKMLTKLTEKCESKGVEVSLFLGAFLMAVVAELPESAVAKVNHCKELLKKHRELQDDDWVEITVVTTQDTARAAKARANKLGLRVTDILLYFAALAINDQFPEVWPILMKQQKQLRSATKSEEKGAGNA